MFTENKDLSSLTTFKLPARAKLFAEYKSEKELLKLSRTSEWLENEILHIGGGSNLLFVTDFDGLVLHSAIKGIRRYDSSADKVYVIAGAGENWSQFVDWCVAEGLSGVENLAGIPGEVGAAPVQNVGAYGVEASDVIHSVECFDTLTRKTVTLFNHECGFGYRESKFKHEWKGRYFVLRVSFRLQSGTVARHLDYGPLRNLSSSLGHSPSVSEVMAEIKKIRSTKLPDPEELGSAGSFFKNPMITEFHFNELTKEIGTDIPHYPAEDGMVKLSAGWMIEHAGLKGERVGGAQVYPRQCLVIVNTGEATASDVVALADKVSDEVMKHFRIRLSPEVNYIDTDIEVTMLGSGTSKGIPEIGCMCATCTSQDPRDKRLRSSVLVRTHGMNILIDPSPDFRQQALRSGIHDLDAILVTHVHFDHIGGLEELRTIRPGGYLPIYVRDDVAAEIRHRLAYCFRENAYPGVPRLDLETIGDNPFMINGLKVTPINVLHGKKPIFGFRIGDFAYITDAKNVDEEEWEKLRGLKLLIVNALRERDHFAHFTLQEALGFIGEIKPERAVLTHFCHEIGCHAGIASKLPANVEAGYDGMRILVK